MSARLSSELQLPWRRDSKVLIGLVYLVTGILVALAGLWKLWALWLKSQPHLPFTLPPDVSGLIATHFPAILSTLINVVASLAAILLGISWCISAIIDLLRSRREQGRPGSLADPESVAESILSYQSEGLKFPKERLPRLGVGPFASHRLNRLSTRISKRIFIELCTNAIKCVVILFIVKAIFVLAGYLPRFVWETTQVAVFVHIPPADPLYYLIAIFVASDVIMAGSLFLMTGSTFTPKSRRVRVSGTVHPIFFLSLLEESVLLATSPRSGGHTKWRLTRTDNPDHYASLMETPQRIGLPSASFAGYPAMILAVVSTILGFYGLINLQFGGAFGTLAQFAAESGLSCLVKVFFLIGLVLLGSHFARWAERFLSWTTWRSSLFLVVVSPEHPDSLDHEFSDVKTPLRTDKISGWVLNPSGACEQRFTVAAEGEPVHFTVGISWASAITESSNRVSERALTGFGADAELENRVDEIMEAPFLAHFERIVDEEAEGGAVVEGDANGCTSSTNGVEV